MSRTVGILFVTWLCIFSVSEAEFGASCSVDDSTNCTATSESCIEGSCNCSNGYSYIDNECKSSAITVSLSLSSNSVLYGSEVTLTASFTSDVPVSIIKWQKVSSDSTTSYLDTDLDKYDQTGDVGTGTVKLTIKGLNFQDKGRYQVEITNNAGTKETSSQVSIDVTGGTITVSLSTISSSVLYGSEVTLTASVSSDLPVSNIIWQKVSGDTTSNLNTNLTKYNLTGDVALGTGTVKLTIKGLNFEDEGNYRVEITNNAGTKNTSDPLSIDVTGGTISIVLSLSSNSVLYGSEVTLTASITSDLPISNIIWQKVSGDTTSNLDTSLAKYNLTGDVGTGTVKLTIKGLNFQDKGSYQVEITNNAGTKETSDKMSIDVTGGTITVSLSPSSSSGMYGSEVTLTASFSSDVPVSIIIWQKVSGDTSSNLDTSLAKYNQTGGVGTGTVKLTINGLVFEDEGNYQVEVINNAGTNKTSSPVSIDVTGVLTVATGADVTGRFGGSVTIDCTVTGPEVSNIQWIKYTNNNPSNIIINNNTYSGGLVTSAALTINKLVETDAAQYQCTASNPGGVYNSVTRATVTVKYGQFNESCTSIERCDPSENLECSPNKCLCSSAYYHKDKECFPKSGLAPTIKELITMTDQFSVSWDNPSIHNELVSAYEVKWRVASSSAGSSGLLSRTKNQYTSPSNLTSGQLYLVNVNSHADLTEPTQSIVVTSGDRNMRTVPLAPGLIIRDESNFSHNNLKIKWTAPVDTVVTKYEITLNGTTYYAMNEDPIYQFNGKDFVPGESYEISIVTVSGTTLDIVKKSSEHTEWIRTIPTKPNPPTNLQCPQSPLDISLEISWTAPTEPNGLILKYQIDVSPGNLQMNTSSNNTHKNVEGLSPEKMYNFTVRTVNDAIDSTSEPSQPKTCKTKAGVSTAPTNLEINEVQSRGFKIEFNKPDNVSGILAAYKIVIYQGGTCVQQILIPGMCSNCNSTFGCPLPINYSVPDITNNDVSYTASGLMPYTNYMVKVVAINGEGDGRPANKTVNTDEEVPRQPEQITASIIENSSLRLTWTYPDQSPGNTTYTIYTYEGTDDLGTHFLMNKSTKVNGFDTKTLLVKGLDEYWLYKFKVNAATVKGNTTSEFSSVFRTKQGEPGQVLNFTVQRKGNDFRTAYVSWSPPALRDHNGVLQSYLFSSNHTGAKKVVQIPVLPTQATVERNISVTPETVYDIEVVLQNNESTKGQPSMQIYRAPAGPPPVTDIEPLTTKPGEHKPTTKTITIEINTTYFKNNDNGKQVFVGVAVCAESKCKDKRVTPEITLLNYWKDLPNWHEASKYGFPLYRVTNDTFKDKVINGSRRRRSVNSGSTTELVIGEDKTCPSLNKDVYCNGQLSPGKSYIVIIFACTSGGCTYSEVDGAFSTQKVPDEEDNAMKIIIGVVVAVVVVAVIVGVAFVVVRRRNRLGETKQYTKGIDNQTTFDEPVPKNIPRKRPIKLKELSDKVAEKHKDSNLHFAREYEDLKALSPKHPAETSELDNNKLKNRYVNILPFDHSRVKLMLTEDDDPSTDFINANYLPGYKSQREYIATQGPIPGTIDDFWRMIWEQNVSIIVMLTLCKEEGRVKCEMYWPENIHEPKQYGDLVVETVSNSTVNFYEFRIFKIKLGDTTRSVKHFHFLQWKDFSANVQNDVMIDFIKNVRNHIRPPDMNGPVVVHCSAGVGRTGTYCALDHLFQFVDEHDLDESIDIFDLVMNLRERRMFMVQTEQQYVFIHDCVRDYVERKKKELQGNLLYENVNRGFVADDEPVEESLYQNYSNQRTDL